MIWHGSLSVYTRMTVDTAVTHKFDNRPAMHMPAIQRNSVGGPLFFTVVL